MFCLGFETNVPNSTANQLLIAEKLFKQADYLTGESTDSVKQETNPISQDRYFSLQDIYVNQGKQNEIKVYKLQNPAQNELAEFLIVELSFRRLTFEHSDCLMLTIRDITHLERLEKQ